MAPTRWLALAALAYGVLHHQGTLLANAGETVNGTRWADWLDIATPYFVLLPVALALGGFGADRLAWALYGVGVLTYAEGHGIHLSANSIGNLDPPGGFAWPPAVHLWDELVGHHLWSLGVALVVVAIARATHDTPPAPGIPAYPLALLVGFTWFTNSVEGGTPVIGLLGAAFLTGVGWVHRGGFDRVLLVAYGPALLLLAGYGAWHRGFPQFTQLGWV